MNGFLDDRKDNRVYDFESDLLFTKTYKENSNSNIYRRELECLKVQIPASIDELMPGDIMAGRFYHRPLGIATAMRSWTSCLDRTGFCLDEIRYKNLVQTNQIDDSTKVELLEMLDFWRNEETIFKIRSQYPERMQREIPSDDWQGTCGVLYGLYRTGGLQPDYEKLVKLGIPGLRKEITDSRKKLLQGEDSSFLDCMLGSLDLFQNTLSIYEQKVAKQLLEITDQVYLKKLKRLHKALVNIQVSKPSTMLEGIQLVWIYALLSGAWELGRMDVYLGDLYVSDLQSGRLTEEEALEILLNFWKIILEVYAGDNRIIVGGMGRPNEKNADQFAILAMEASRIHKMTYPQLSLRFYDGMNKALMKKALDVLSEGTTFPILFNDDVNVPSMEKAFQVSRDEAEDYVFFGCGEFVINHRGISTPSDVINLLKVLEITLNNGKDLLTGQEMGLKLGDFNSFNTFDELLDAYKKQAEYFTDIAADHQELEFKVTGQEVPFLFLSMLFDDCISRNKPILAGGLRYLGGTYETYGNISTSDSLFAIKKAVYEEKRFTQDQLLTMLKANFEGFEKERKVLQNYPKYGNDLEEADEMAVLIHEHICHATRNQKDRTSLSSYLVVEINNSANTTFGLHTAASADGRLALDTLSNGNNPSPGADKNGITALINSLTKMDISIMAGATQNLKFSKDLFVRNREKLEVLLDSFFMLGGSQANINVVSKEDLENAMIYPEKYQNLIYRIGGYSARFIDFAKEVQQDIIRRTTY